MRAYTNLCGYRVCLSSFWRQTCFASIACGHPHAHFWGVPQTPALLLRDDSDADNACDAVLRISLYHIPDSASLASSASFRFCVSRSIIVFVSSSSKLQASFHYKRDGGDDGDGLSCIPLPISHKHRHYRHHRHLKQASRFNLRLACFNFDENFVGYRSNLAPSHWLHNVDILLQIITSQKPAILFALSQWLYSESVFSLLT